MPKNLLISTLKHLFTLSSAGAAPCFVDLCQNVSADPAAVSEALDQLEARGLVDADRMRLTMRGLAFAVSMGAEMAPAREQASTQAPLRRVVLHAA